MKCNNIDKQSRFDQNRKFRKEKLKRKKKKEKNENINCRKCTNMFQGAFQTGNIASAI